MHFHEPIGANDPAAVLAARMADQAKNDEAGQSQPMTNTASDSQPADRRIALLRARVGLEAQNADHARRLCAERADQIELLSVELHSQCRAHDEHRAALNKGRNALHVFTAEPDVFISKLIERQRNALEGMEKVIAFLNLTLIQPEALRQERFVKVEDVANHVEVIRLALEILHTNESGFDRVLPALPLDPNLIGDWLITIRASIAADRATRQGEPKPQGPAWYCPTCKRHVAPEDVCEGEVGPLHAEHKGGCGEVVELRNPTE